MAELLHDKVVVLVVLIELIESSDVRMVLRTGYNLPLTSCLRISISSTTSSDLWHLLFIMLFITLIFPSCLSTTFRTSPKLPFPIVSSFSYLSMMLVLRFSMRNSCGSTLTTRPTSSWSVDEKAFVMVVLTFGDSSAFFGSDSTSFVVATLLSDPAQLTLVDAYRCYRGHRPSAAATSHITLEYLLSETTMCNT